MADGLDKSVERFQTFVPVEKSLSIDPHLDRDKQQNTKRQNKRHTSPLTVEEQLEREETLRSGQNENENHVDYHA